MNHFKEGWWECILSEVSLKKQANNFWKKFNGHAKLPPHASNDQNS